MDPSTPMYARAKHARQRLTWLASVRRDTHVCRRTHAPVPADSPQPALSRPTYRTTSNASARSVSAGGMTTERARPGPRNAKPGNNCKLGSATRWLPAKEPPHGWPHHLRHAVPTKRYVTASLSSSRIKFNYLETQQDLQQPVGQREVVANGPEPPPCVARNRGKQRRRHKGSGSTVALITIRCKPSIQTISTGAQPLLYRYSTVTLPFLAVSRRFCEPRRPPLPALPGTPAKSELGSCERACRNEHAPNRWRRAHL